VIKTGSMSHPNAVIYEVSVSVPVAGNADYAKYMKTTHIPDIMATGHFYHITMTSSRDDLLGTPAEPDWVHYKTSYFAPNAEELKAYLTNDAPRLRADFMQHFPKDAKVSRRVWAIEQEWKKQ